MAKLFAFETTAEQTVENNTLQKIGINDTLDNIRVAQESVDMANTQLDIVTSIKKQINGGGFDAGVGMEHLSPIIESIANNFGVRSNLPSLESYKNKYSCSVAKTLALESIGGFFKAIWDRLVGFVKALFNAFKGLIIGFKGNEAKGLTTLENMQKKVEALIAGDAVITNTDQISTSLPALLSGGGVTDFTSSDLVMQTNIRVEAFIGLVEAINKADGKVNTELHEKLNNINSGLSDALKLAADLSDKIKVSAKKDILPIDQMADVQKFITGMKLVREPFGAIKFDYFPEPMLEAIGDGDLPTSVLEKVKNIRDYVSFSAKRVKLPPSLNNMSYYVVTTIHNGEKAYITVNIHGHMAENKSAPSMVDPISSPEELKKVINTVVNLSKRTLTIDVKRVTDIFSKVLEQIKENSIKIDAVMTSILTSISSIKKDAELAEFAAATGTTQVEDEVRDSFTDSVNNFKKDLDSNVAIDTNVRMALLTASKELVKINSDIVKVKALAVNEYTLFFNKNLKKFG